MRGRWTLAAAAWFAAAALTTMAGLAAVNSLGAGLFGATDRPRTAEEVERDLAAAGASTAPPGAPPATSTTAAANTPRGLSTEGGNLVASCAGGLATLHSWTPADGFRADDPVRGPATTASVKFKKGRNEMTVLVTCVGGQPRARVIPDED